MGLSIEVGYLTDMITADEEGAEWLREEISKLNTYFDFLGLSKHNEPEDCPIYSAEMFGYSGIHYLRRIAAHLQLRGSLPSPGDKDAAKDPILEEYYTLMQNGQKSSYLGRFLGKKVSKREFDHLIFHSDAEGFYVPQDFPDVIFPPEELKITGGMVGSSRRLLNEVTTISKALRIPPVLDPESDEVWAAADSQGSGTLLWQRYGVESFVCLRLIRAAQHSISHSALIVFS